jgi:hypothetical protein
LEQPSSRELGNLTSTTDSGRPFTPAFKSRLTTCPWPLTTDGRKLTTLPA